MVSFLCVQNIRLPLNKTLYSKDKIMIEIKFKADI